MLAFIPDALKERMLDVLIDFVASQGEKFFDSRFGDKIRGLSSQGAVRQAFDEALARAFTRFQQEYIEQDEDLVADLAAIPDFWQNTEVRKALLQIVSRPRSWNADEQATVAQHFETVLPQRRNRQRVDQAIAYLLRCVAEEVWNIPAAKEIREIYALQTQRVSAEALQRQVALLEANLNATTQISGDIREALLQLIQAQQRQLLSTSAEPAALPPPRPWDNLPQPHYARFVGRERELAWLRQRLSPQDRVWQALIVGIGGVGKSALAQAIAYEYHDRYAELLPEERFEAIVWVSAKEEVLTASGHEAAAPGGLIFRTLNDVYAAIAQVLRRDDIARAALEDRDRLIQGVLAEQRTLLVIDNFESVVDERVRSFLRNLPQPTKTLITSREWIDTAAVLRLTGLDEPDAAALIASEAEARTLSIGLSQRRRLVERTAGLPLPIRLSVARLAAGESFDAVIRWLGDVAGDLPEYCVRGQAELLRQRAPFAWPLLLGAALFDRTAGVSVETLSTVADLSQADCDDGLAALQRLSLINRADDQRLSLLPIVEAYARALLRQDSAGTTIIDRWIAWAVAFAEREGRDLDLHIERFEPFGDEYPNVRAAFRWCREERRWADIVRLGGGLYFYPYIQGQIPEVHEIAETVMQALDQLGDEHGKSSWLILQARLLARQGRSHERIAVLDRVEATARASDDPNLLSQVLRQRANDFALANQPDSAVRAAEEAVALNSRVSSGQRTLAHYELAQALATAGRYAEALAQLDLAEHEATALGWTRMQTWMLLRRADYLLNLGETAQAEQPLLTCLAHSSHDEPRLQSSALTTLARLHLALGRPTRARAAIDEAHIVVRRLAANEGVTHISAELDALLRQADEQILAELLKG